MDSKELLQLTVEAADDKRADDIVALDVAEVSLMADYLSSYPRIPSAKFKRLLIISWTLCARPVRTLRASKVGLRANGS